MSAETWADPEAEPAAARRAPRPRRRRPPARRADRPALVRRGQARDPRLPRARHPQPRGRPGASCPQSERPRVLVSQSGAGWYGHRGDERLDESTAEPRERLPRAGDRGLGGRGERRRGAGRARGPDPHRCRCSPTPAARSRRCCPSSSRHRRPGGGRAPVRAVGARGRRGGRACCSRSTTRPRAGP